MRPDDELLRDFAERGNEAAFTELVRRHLDLVYSSALRQVGRDAHLANDVAQTVFVGLAQKASTLTDRASLAGWLYTSTHYAAANTVRAERRRRIHEQESLMRHETHFESSVALDWDRLRPVLDAAMLELNDGDREIVVQRFFGGRSFAEIGCTMRMNEDTARKRATRALDKLHALLSRRGIRSTSSALALALSSHAISAAPAGLAATVSAAVLTSSGLPAATAAITPFLTMSKLSISLAGATVALLSVVLVHQHREVTAARAEVTALHQAHARLSDETAVLRTRRAHETGPAAPSANPPPEKNAPSPIADLITRMSSPEQLRVALDGLYAPLFRQLRLPPERLETLRELLITKRRAHARVDLMIAEAKLPPGLLIASDCSQLEQMAAREIDEQIRAFLGGADAAYYDSFHRTLSVRTLLASPIAMLRNTPEPLRDEQVEALVGWIAAEFPSPNRFEELGLPTLWKHVLRGAATIVSPAQLEKFALYERGMESWQQIIALNRSAEAKGLITAASHSRAP